MADLPRIARDVLRLRRDPDLQDQSRTLQSTTGWRWHGGNSTEGPTVVACMEILDWLRGTEWMPDLDGVVLLLETSEEAPPPHALLRFLRTLQVSGDLERLAGFVLGRLGGADLTEEQRHAYDTALLRAVRTEAGLDELPIVTGVDFGHTDPMWTVPQGVAMRLDTDERSITFVEPVASTT